MTLIPEEGDDDVEGPPEDGPPVKKRIAEWSQAIVKRNRNSDVLQGSGRFVELISKVRLS